MAIKVNFLSGATTATVSGLYQWDYGQILEIECNEIGSEILEVHFACANMAEAIVRTCAFTNGVGTVTIPDECLEQNSTVTAWVYKVDSTQGHTIKAITLPITARTRPSNTRSVPADYNDKYGQLIEEVNEAIDAIEKGNVTAHKALSAKSADYATTATSATNATYATSAGSASTVNKYLHNVGISLEHSDNDVQCKGHFAIQIINNSADSFAMGNITSQIPANRPLPCSGHFYETVRNDGGTMYFVIGLKLLSGANVTIQMVGYDDSMTKIPQYTYSLSKWTVEYDTVIPL